MAKCILATNSSGIESGDTKQPPANDLGITYHSKKHLGDNIAKGQVATYRLAPGALFTIHQQAPSWKTGPGDSHISGFEIETQRLAYIKLHGDDGLNELSHCL